MLLCSTVHRAKLVFKVSIPAVTTTTFEVISLTHINTFKHILTQLELDVLDDTLGEGASVIQLNPWIGYGEALQRVREFGCAPKVRNKEFMVDI